MIPDDYCACENPSKAHIEFGELQQWLVCDLCNKRIDPLRENLDLVIREGFYRLRAGRFLRDGNNQPAIASAVVG